MYHIQLLWTTKTETKIEEKTKKNWQNSYLFYRFCKVGFKSIKIKISITYLDWVEAGSHAAILNFHMGRGMCKFTLCIRPCAFIALVLPTDFESKPSRVLYVTSNCKQTVYHGHYKESHQWKTGGFLIRHKNPVQK